MTNVRRKFTPEDRLSILREAEREGRANTLRKYNISPSLYNRWRKKYLSEGLKGLKDEYKRTDPEVLALQAENERLKRIVARQALELEVKSELLKKTSFQPGTK
ncbi:MAG: transposase [Bacteroidaceae bacterium]|jgi:transposase-like protein